MPRQPKDPFGPVGRYLAQTALLLQPKGFRREFRDQWIEFLQEQRREARYRSPILGPFLFWTDILRDLVVSLPRNRREWSQPEAWHVAHGNGRLTMDSLFQDLRFALRTLSRRPLFTAISILTLGLGIGAATAMFSVVDGVLLADSRYADPDRLMSIWQTIEGREGYTDAGEIRLHYPQYRALHEESTAFEDVAVYAAAWGEGTLSGNRRPELVHVGAATASLLPVLGITPVLGRWFLPEEEVEGAGGLALVTVLSYENWVSRYHQDREILGKIVVLDNQPRTVVGVLPPGFRMQWLSASVVGAADPGQREFWVPAGSPGWEIVRGSAMWEAVGRLAVGATLEHARAETSVILDENWDWGTARSIILPRMSEEVRGLGSPLLLLLGATGLLLLIACGNVAALSLGEMQGRVHEVATRAAIGAGRRRIVRQLLTESLVLGMAGSVLGALMALAGTGALVSLAPAIPRIDLVRVDLPVLAFAAVLGTIAGALFGVAPAFVTAREAVGTTLRSGGRAGSRRREKLGRWALASEIGLTVMLVVASGLLVQSLSRLQQVPLGFEPENVASIQVRPPNFRYGSGETLSAFMNEVILEMETIPGVSDVSAASTLPFPGNASGWAMRLQPEDTDYLMPEGSFVAPGYLEFLGISILDGRGIVRTDDAEAPPIIVVSQSLARAFWPDRSPVGEELFYPMGSVTVVGVADDVKQGNLHEDGGLHFYAPFAQQSRRTLRFAVRTRASGVDVLPAMREALWRVDEELAITDAGYLTADIGNSAAEERFRAFLMSVFASLATILAVVGIMGVTARHVAHRTREMGIRKALGAENSALLSGVVGEAMRIGAVGIAFGLLATLSAGRVLAAFLFGVGRFDIVTYAGVAVLFLGVCGLASYIPGRRLLVVDPVTVLREE